MHHLLRLVQRLGEQATSPRWLVEGLTPEQDRLWSSFDFIMRDELSWFNRALDRLWSSFDFIMREELSWFNRALATNTRRALFQASDALRGDNATRKLFLTCLVHSARHGDSEVWLATCRALPAVFAVYPNSLGVWSNIRSRGSSLPPSEGLDAEAAALASPPPITSSQAVPLPADSLQKRLSLLMASGTAGKASDKVTRLAVLVLCQWWGAPGGAAGEALGVKFIYTHTASFHA
jgi:hypothetical protein